MNRNLLRLDPRGLFKFDRSALDLTRPTIGIAIVLVALILLSVVGPIGFTAAFGAVLAVSLDGGGARRQRFVALGIFASVGALLTYLGNAASAGVWASIALVFVVTLLCGLALAFGSYAGKMAFLLNLWMMIALSLAVAIHEPALLGLGFFLGGAGAAVLLVLKPDHPVTGNPAQAATPSALARLRAHLTLYSPILHFALSRAIVAAVAMWLGWLAAPAHPFWIALTFLIVLVPDRAQAARTSWQRAIGTILGVALAALILALDMTPTTLLLLWLLVVLLMLAVQGVNYLLYSTILTLNLLLLYPLLEADTLFNGMERLVTTLLGIALALGVVFFLEYLAQRTISDPAAAEP